MFTDFQSRSIELSDEAWDHIATAHSEVSQRDIEATLREPDEVRESGRKPKSKDCQAELFYRRKHPDNGNRYWVVVIKVCRDGNFVTTAYTGSAIKEGPLVYRRNSDEGAL